MTLWVAFLLILSPIRAKAVPLLQNEKWEDVGPVQKHGGMESQSLYGGDILGNPSINNEGYGTPWITEGTPGRIPFIIHSSLNRQWQRTRIMQAIREIETKTCIKFVERNSSDPECGGACNTYLQIQDGGGGCSSYVGMRSVCPQEVNLQVSVNCITHSTIVHELGHAIGLLHTHQRSDRDDFINVHLENVNERYRRAFNKEDGGRKLVPYDTTSVMHYDSYAASNNGKPTITLKNGGLIEDPRGLSATDAKAINIMYGCNA